MEIVPYNELTSEERKWADLVYDLKDQGKESKIAEIICAPFKSMEPGMQPPTNQIKDRLRKARELGADIHKYSKMNTPKLRGYFGHLQKYYQTKINH